MFSPTSVRSGDARSGSDPKAPPVYSFMECYDYPFYETLDVRFYGSMPLVKFWPDIEKSVMREFADDRPARIQRKNGVDLENRSTPVIPTFRIRKAKGAVPHDLGVPQEDPFKQINQFSWQDTNGWKDLNPKFVLMIYRDFVLTGRKDKAFLRDTWPAVQEVHRISPQVRQRRRRHARKRRLSRSDL